VGTAGDVNADGYSDLIVGAFEWDDEEINEGKAFVFHGSADGPPLDANWSVEGNQQPAFLGVAVGTAGDVNGDGYSDVVVGCRDCGSIEGAAFVYHGSANGLSQAAAWSNFGTPGSSFGSAVGTAGDVNGDGFADLIVGARQQDVTITDEGAAYVYYGSSAGLPGTPSWTLLGQHSGGFLGYSVGTAGDVDGDGNADVLVGAPYHSGGRSRLFYGNGRGPTIRPRQLLVSGSGPIANLGTSDAPDAVRLSAIARTPFGRGFVRLEWEAKPLGTAFDGTNLGQSPPADTGLSGVEIGQTATGLTEGPVYHWRARIVYDPATVPWQSRGRWFTVPWNGWQEGDVRLACNDGDGDGFGSFENGTCPGGPTMDCDDTDPTVYPGAPELCDGLSNDCDDFSWPSPDVPEIDIDGDGYVACSPWVGGPGPILGGGDCDIFDPNTHPGAPEVNDGLDNQCPGDPGFGVVDESTEISGFFDPTNPNAYSWPPQAGATMYEAQRSGTPDFSGGCSGIITADPLFIDLQVPPSGSAFFYMNRAIAPFLGSWGENSMGERIDVCP
jgi:hypothetical protein